jgi:DNA-binding NarL/FixJ family response regulator
MTTKVAFADDKSINRQSFADKIRLLGNVELVFLATNGNHYLEQLKGLPHNRLPDIAFIDLEMPEMDGITTISLSKALYPNIVCIVLTVLDDDDKLFEAIRAGANGYLLKDEGAQSIGDAITNVMQFGGAPMSPGIARKAFNLLSHAQVVIPKSNTLQKEIAEELLSAREKEILSFTTHGWDAKRIASELDLSVHTVRKHIANIYQKLHITSKAQMMQLAYKNNWMKE